MATLIESLAKGTDALFEGLTIDEKDAFDFDDAFAEDEELEECNKTITEAAEDEVEDEVEDAEVEETEVEEETTEIPAETLLQITNKVFDILDSVVTDENKDQITDAITTLMDEIKLSDEEWETIGIVVAEEETPAEEEAPAEDVSAENEEVVEESLTEAAEDDFDLDTAVDAVVSDYKKAQKSQKPNTLTKNEIGRALHTPGMTIAIKNHEDFEDIANILRNNPHYNITWLEHTADMSVQKKAELVAKLTNAVDSGDCVITYLEPGSAPDNALLAKMDIIVDGIDKA